MQLDVLCSTISAWSFDQECTPENIRKFLTEAPQIVGMIDKVAGSDARFFGKGSTSSSAGPKANLNSGKSRKAPRPR